MKKFKLSSVLVLGMMAAACGKDRVDLNKITPTNQTPPATTGQQPQSGPSNVFDLVTSAPSKFRLQWEVAAPPLKDGTFHFILFSDKDEKLVEGYLVKGDNLASVEGAEMSDIIDFKYQGEDHEATLSVKLAKNQIDHEFKLVINSTVYKGVTGNTQVEVLPSDFVGPPAPGQVICPAGQVCN